MSEISDEKLAFAARSAPAALSCVRRYLMRTEARFVVTLEKNLESSVQTTAKGTMQQAAKPRRLKRSLIVLLVKRHMLLMNWVMSVKRKIKI